MLKTLGETIASLNTTSETFGVWADAPFTWDSDCRLGPTQFENGGVLDNKAFVGTVATLSPMNADDVAVPHFKVAWSEIRDGAAHGVDSVTCDTAPAGQLATLVHRLWTELSTYAGDDNPPVPMLITEKELAQWCIGVTHGDELTFAGDDNIVYVVQYHNELDDGPDEGYVLQLIDAAETERVGRESSL